MIMRKFIKLNIFAVFYAFVLLLQEQMLGNVSRISRMADLDITATEKIIGAAVLIIFIASTLIALHITTKYFSTGRTVYFLSVLWVPYNLIFARLCGFLMPISPQDKPTPVLGFLFIAADALYPVYIALISVLSQRYFARKS
jgi:hypothetical protein